ncbi:hypothetical protein [Variovorax sp. UC74_104]|uniref:hypothetical protein n=1 Tax=Variovorax sp. UC74_104 TaxID=3374555 RepID=UPI00375656E3
MSASPAAVSLMECRTCPARARAVGYAAWHVTACIAPAPVCVSTEIRSGRNAPISYFLDARQRAGLVHLFLFEARKIMATSSILGGERAPITPKGTDAESLGPSDSSDSGSDASGTNDAADEGGLEAPTNADILPDRVGVLPDAAAEVEGSVDDPGGAERAGPGRRGCSRFRRRGRSG